MARLGFAGIALALVFSPDIALARIDPAVGAPPVPPMPVTRSMPTAPMASRPMRQPDRWSSVPGGWEARRQPGYGYMLPRYWVAPAHFISDYRGYGLPQPAWGYGWSRYYDDVVLTDRWGRVYDWRPGDDLGDGRMGNRLHKRRSGRQYERFDNDGPLMRPHWDMDYAAGPVPEPVAVVEPVPMPCREIETVRYVTEYVPVRTKAPRTKYVPSRRTKAVPVT